MEQFTSESVTEGHPDKICDQISDRILDEILTKDKNARVACEVLVTRGLVIVTGEITTNSYVDIPKIVKRVIKDIGYVDKECGFDCNSLGIMVSIDEQSPDIKIGVDNSLESKNKNSSLLERGAGDQGMVFGFACDQSSCYMPLPIYLAHNLAKKLSTARKNKTIDFLKPDGKTQVTVCYDKNGKAIHVDTVIISAQHKSGVTYDKIKACIIEKIINEVIPNDLFDSNTKIFVNPTGNFVIGGPMADTGLTGRKIMVDTYGGYARHGGGAFSGKDPTKVDRSGAYLARFIAKNIVANKLAAECEVQISYCIGVAKPVSVMVETRQTAKIKDEKIEKLIKEKFDMRVEAIIERFDLLRPIYSKTSTYGHFGREDTIFPWEEIVEI